jgi:amino acid transporter
VFHATAISAHSQEGSPVDGRTNRITTRNPTQNIQKLKRNAIGTMAVIFMAVATAAPITAMVGNVPIAVGFGNGSHAPAGYFFATVVLGLFAIGYATMAKHITATGAFYGYISHGLGRVVGMASGLLITMAILIVQSLCAFAVIAYFHFHKFHPSGAHWFKTFLAPLLGGIGMLYVVYLLWEHKDAAAGAASGTLLFKLTPWIVVGLFLFGAAMALYCKFRDARRYDLIGRIVFEDAEVRD